MIRKLMRALLFVLITCILSSCYPEFENAISPDTKIDSNVFGEWMGTTANQERLLILPRMDNWADIIYVYDVNSPKQSDGANILIMEGYTATLEKQKFLCVRFRKKDHPAEARFNFYIFAYSFPQKNDIQINGVAVKQIKHYG